MSRDEPTYSVEELAAAVKGRLEGPQNLRVNGVEAFDRAGPTQITFIADAAHARRWSSSHAGVALITDGLEADSHDPAQRALIVVADAELALIEILRMFEHAPPMPEPGVHPSAWVHESVSLGRDVRIGPQVTIDRDVVVGDGVVLHAGCRLYADVTIGQGSVIHANCVIAQRCRIGRDVIVHPGAVIGADGFGYRPAPKTGPDSGVRLLKMPHLGGVVIEDEVEIGANCCIDRGKFSDTVIGRGTKIDNLVQIAHNCQVGQICVIVGQAGLAGSVTVGDGVQIGAQAGVADQITIGAGARIGARAGLMRDVAAGQTILGTPGEEASVALRQYAALRKLPDLMKQLKGPSAVGSQPPDESQKPRAESQRR